jgi:hypothetical protein
MLKDILGLARAQSLDSSELEEALAYISLEKGPRIHQAK